MKNSEKFKILFNELDNLNRNQIKLVIDECIKLMMEMLPDKKRGGF